MLSNRILVSTFCVLATQTTEAKMQNTEANKKVIRVLFEDYVNLGKVDDLKDLVAETYIDQSSGKTGLKVYQDSIRSIRTGFPDVKFEIKELIAEGKKVVVRWQWQGTHQGVFNGIQPTHKKAKANGTVIYEIENGKVVSSFGVIDRLSPLQDIGVVPRDFSKSSSGK